MHCFQFCTKVSEPGPEQQRLYDLGFCVMHCTLWLWQIAEDISPPIEAGILNPDKGSPSEQSIFCIELQTDTLLSGFYY